MAKQKGAHPMIGTVGELTYYRTAESGMLVRKKSSLDKARIMNDPVFEPTRQQSDEFGRGSQAAKLVRATMEVAGFGIGDKRIHSRLSGALRKALFTDTTHEKGKRTLEGADLSSLLHFEWNKFQAFGNIYNGTPKFSIDATTGLMEIDLDGIRGRKDFNAQPAATHVQFVLEGGAFDFALNEGKGVSDTTNWLSLTRKHPVQTMNGTVPVKPGVRLMLGIGIRFGQESNDVIYELFDKQYRGFVVGMVV
jgi:hypothetical protein